MGIELLAPAGDFDCVRAAVSAGADAVYVGASKFSARQNATNFNKEELDKAISYCHIRGVKVYLAINTLIADTELDEALNKAKEAYESGVDAFIVQDIGVAKLLRDLFDIPVHASTQMTVFDSNGIDFLKKIGIKRVVLARECSKKEIEKIGKNSEIETEIFCHGAICVSYSGQCLMSSMIGGRSANRGLCAQPCRLPYSIDNKKAYYLSPKDLSLVDYLDEIKNANVKSLKIEGRMKGPSYVAATVSVFRKAIDKGQIDESDREMLIKAFSRGGKFTKGCYGEIKGEEMMNIHSSNDNVLKSADENFVKGIKHHWAEGKENKKIQIKASFEVKDGKTVFKIMDDEKNTVVTARDNIYEEKGKALDEKYAASQLNKMGATPYEIKDLSTDIYEKVYYSASFLNALRREAVEKLSSLRDKKRTYNKDITIEKYLPKEKKAFYISASVSNKEQAKALIDLGIKVYVPYDIPYVKGCYGIIIPPVFEERELHEGCDVILAGSIGAYEFALKKGKKVIPDIGMNIYNSISANMFDSVTLSSELSLTSCKSIADSVSSEVLAYGYIPLMTMKNCIIKSSGNCDGKNCNGCKKTITIKDRKGIRFKIVSNGKINTLYNSVPVFMADKLDDIKKANIDGVRLNFTDETPEECISICKMYEGKTPIIMPEKYTRGHFYK